jgi:hypothetical protein
MADAEVPIKYMERTRHFYRALGYTKDYIWATFDDVPFSQPAKPLSEMRIVLITTASPVHFGPGFATTAEIVHRQRGLGQGIDSHKRPGQFSPD